jgi:exosortase A
VTAEQEVIAVTAPAKAATGEVLAPPRAESAVATRERSALGVPLTVAMLAVGVLALYWRTTLSMISIWARSETFVHGFIVVPIFFYLLWRERKALDSIETRPCLGALFGVVAAGAVWLLGELVNAVSVSQFAMIAMIPFAVWTVLGTRVVMALGIPLGFLFFAVPFGDFLIPTLIDRTADFTVAALRASGVPVYREGNYFTIPSGNWSVVEACSGLRYLIASFMVGCLYAYLSYRSPIRRAAFIAASILVPIVANWMRAYMIVMLGHLSNNELAVGVDHLIYGWIFFGVVMTLLFWVGGRWREDNVGADAAFSSPAASTGPDATTTLTGNGRRWTAVAAVLLLAVPWQPMSAQLSVSGNTAPVALLPIAGERGWVASSDPLSAWKPDISGARTEYRETYVKDGKRVGLHISFFRGQAQDAKAITSTNALVSENNKLWRQTETGTVRVDLGAGQQDMRTAVVINPAARLGVWQWYWVDGHDTSSIYAAKLYQSLSVLLRHGDPAAWIVVYTPTETDEAEVRATLQAFTSNMRGAIDAALKQAAAQ